MTALVIVLALVAATPPNATPPANAQTIAGARGLVDESLDRVPGEIIVKYRDATSASARASLLDENRVASVKSFDRLGVQLLRTTPGEEVATARRLQSDPRVEIAEPNYRAHTFVAPTDPQNPAQYDMPLIGMEQAWGVSTGSSSVITAVIDGGVDFGHPDLAGRIANLTGAGLPGPDHVFLSSPAPGCAPVSGPDDDGWTGTGSPVSHGTHVSGTILANSTLAGGAAVGVAGIAPATLLAPLKAADCEGSLTLVDIAAAITFATFNGAKVINMSVGTTGDVAACSLVLQIAIDTAFNNGVFLAAAMGNDGSTNRSMPAICNHVTGVAATDMVDVPARFSEHNAATDIAAPGVSILSTLRATDGTHTYGILNGTSMATPHVAGCAALVRSVNPTLGPDQIEQLFRATAIDLGLPGRDDYFGSGRLDCGASVLAAANIPIPTRTPTATSPVGGPVGVCGSVPAAGASLVAGGLTPGVAGALGEASHRSLQVIGEAIPAPDTHAAISLPQGWSSITCEGFEGPWPTGSWQVFDNKVGPGSTGGTCWGVNTFQVRFGARSAWPAAGCSNAVNPANANYPNNLDSWAVFGPFSLADAQDAAVEMTLWRQQVDTDKIFMVASNDNLSFSGISVTGSSSTQPPPTVDGWQGFTLPLGDASNGVNLLGSPQVWVGLVFQSNGVGANRGPFVDDFVVMKRTVPAVSPTSSPTRTPTLPPGAPTFTPSLTPTQTTIPPTVTATPTRTPSRTPTPPQIAIGGKNLSIGTNGAFVNLNWQGGTTQTSYSILRLANGQVSTIASIPPNATGFGDTTAQPGLNCYLLQPQVGGQPASSDLECAFVGFHSPTGAPQAFTLRLNQTSTATLSWAPPPGATQDSFLLVTLGQSSQTLSRLQTSVSLPVSGATCFAVGSVTNGLLTGWTDILCGLPGFSNLGP